MTGKNIFISGSTDGIGLAAARKFVALGHTVLIHGRSCDKIAAIERSLAAGGGRVESYRADLSDLADVAALATAIAARHHSLDVLINNAGVYNVADPRTADGLDVRFVVNTIAPYLLSRRLLPNIAPGGRIINLSSAAQSPVDLEALSGRRALGNGAAYAQSKLAITMWSRELSRKLGKDGPMILALNPGSLLGTKMVREAFGVAGSDIDKGADILVHAALSDELASAGGQYFDNDSGRLAPPHRDALDTAKARAVTETIETILSNSGTVY